MRKYRCLLVALGFFGCDAFSDIKEEGGPCTIVLVGGATIESQGAIEILESTNVITYRDTDGKLWSLAPADYESYSCGN